MKIQWLIPLSLAAVACSSAENGSAGTTSSNGSGGSGGSPTGAGGSGASGGQPGWEQLGLDGDRVPYLAVAKQTPSTIFAGTSQGSTDQGFFRSTDGGQTWPQAPELDVVWPTGLEVAPDQDITLADVGVDGLCRSTNGGSNWSPTSFVGNSYGIEFDPNSSTVWLSDGAEVWRSPDGGVSWSKTPNTGLPTGQRSVEFPTFDGTTLYVAVGNQGVYASSDNGDSFTPANTGLPFAQSFGGVIALEADVTRPGFALAQTNGQGLYRTDDSGATWTKVDMGAETTKYGALLIDPTNPTTFYVSRDSTGMLKSTDDGASWMSIGPDTEDVIAVDLDPTTGALYIGTLGTGVWRLGN
ncbi:MAG TPA: hypothetical protein VFB62_28470 [Polyangiaceae bacterium]|nr:hypothetical protein [Polyangiaceae bacterium]